MKRIEVILLIGAVIGVGCGAFLVAQRPDFWVGVAVVAFNAAWPFIWAYVSRRNDAETEERMRQCIRRGRKWDNFKKRCE